VTAKSVAVAAIVGAMAGFAAGRIAAPAPDQSDVEELKRLSAKLDRIETELREAKTKMSHAESAEDADKSKTHLHKDSPCAPFSAVSANAREMPSADPYASWTDDEIYLVAQSKGDDLGLFKAALRRNHPAERRAKLLLAKAAYCHKLEWHGPAEREALVEAVGLAPTTTAAGAEASLALSYSYAAYLDDRWRCRAYFESVLRDAPNAEQRMKGAYGLAWMHDLGDEPTKAAIDAYREFLDQWGEKWKDTNEADWARHRIALHEAAK